MSKHFKLRFSFPSFQLCRLKQPSLLPQTPSPATYRFSPANPKAFDIAYPNLPEPPPSTPDHLLLFKRHLSNNDVSVDYGCRSRSSCFQSNNVSSEYGNKKKTSTVPVPEKSEEESKLHHRKLYNSPVSDVSDASDTWPVRLPRAEKTKMKDRKEEEKKAKARVYRSNSSVECDNIWFSTDDNEETESLVSSSRSFESSNCYDSVFGNSLEAISEGAVTDAGRKTTKKNKKQVRTALNHSEETKKAAASGSGYPAKTSVLRWLGPCTVEGKVTESFAVVKRSEDPYEDFKRSMLEMILEKQMSEAKDLKQLLVCFLSLNSRYHHAAIVDAFTEIWEALFCDTPFP